MRAGKEAEIEENTSTTISNIKLYNLVRDSLKSNASLGCAIVRRALQDSGARPVSRSIIY